MIKPIVSPSATLNWLAFFMLAPGLKRGAIYIYLIAFAII